MPVAFEVSVEDARWDGFDLAATGEAAVAAALGHLGIDLPVSVSVLATNDARIAQLNADFRGKAVPTNVLSWPSEELRAGADGGAPEKPSDPEIGDIALAYETCVREAEEFGIPVHDHVTHLMLHGVLHLLGFDHERGADATLMEDIEIMSLEKLGIKNPYETLV